MVITLRYLFILILGYVIALCEAEYCYYDKYSYRHYINCSSHCCGSDSYRYCCSFIPTGTIVGAVFGSVMFVVIVVSIVACCFCAWCPGYRYRSQGTIITTVQQGRNYQTILNEPYQDNNGPYLPQNTGPYPPQQTGPYTYTSKPAGGYNYPPLSYQV